MKTYQFGSSPSARCIRSLTGKNLANDPRYRHRARASGEASAVRLSRKIEKIKLMAARKGMRKAGT